MARRGRSIRLRLTSWYAVALTVVLVGYATAVYFFLRQDLSRDLDRQVHDDYEAAEANVEVAPDGEIRWRASLEETEGAGDDRWIEVRARDGGLIHRRSPSRGSRAPDLPEAGLDRVGAQSLDLAPGVRVRLYQGEHRVGDQVVVVRAARSEVGMRGQLSRLWLVLALTLPLGVGLASIDGYLIAWRALEPLARMVRQARGITAEHLHERLPVDHPDDELGQLGAAFNEVFARLERSFDQLRRFTADASHELRTPLTALRAVGEVGLRDDAGAEALREVIGSMLEEVDRLTRLVDALLQLARAEGGRITLALEPIALRQLAQEAAAQVGVLAEERGQSIRIEGSDGVVRADAVVLRQAIVNLLHNAIKYAPAGSAISLIAETRGESAELCVTDVGPGIPPDEQERVFERFYRGDPARGVGGFGLGLAMARWAVQAHGGTILLESEPGVGSTFRIRLPLSAAAA